MAKKINKKRGKIFKIFSALLILISIILISAIICFNTLPNKYLISIIAVIAVIDLILVFLMLKSKKKKIGAFISFIVMIIMSLISFYIFKTTGILNNLNLDYKTYNYSVVVLKEGNYEKIEEIENKDLGYYETEGPETEKSLTKLSKKVQTQNVEYDDYHKMASELLDKKLDAILIENSYLQILEENDGETISGETGQVTQNSIENFSDKIKVIYTFSIKVKTSDISKDLDVTKKPFSIYVSGIDTYGSISSVSRSDVNMIVTVNPQTKQILLTSVPRDYYVQLHGTSGYKDKLTHAGLYGVDMSIQTLEDLFDIEINYYIKVNFTSVIDIVDAIGGVNVYSNYTFTSIDGYNYTKGYNEVNGKEALSFARERKAFSAGDRQRVKDQQALLEAIFRKVISPSIITKYNSLLNSVSGSFVTNMPTDRLTSLLKMQLAKNYKWTITANSLDGSDSSNYTYSYSSQKLYVMEPIEESVEYAKELINSVIDGEKLDPSFDGNSSDIHKVTQNSTTNKTQYPTTNNSNTKNTEGLKATLGRSSVTLIEGDTFTYYGYNATYNGTNITNSSEVTFSINGKTYTTYQDLVEYITNSLSTGEYNIVYKISYKGDNITLNQAVIIKENPAISTPDDSSDDSSKITTPPNDSDDDTQNNDTIETEE